MRTKVLMAALVITLMLGVRGYAGPWNPCDRACVDPCAPSCVGFAPRADLFSGLKRLVSGVRFNDCNPCNGVVACNPCDMVACHPCDAVCDPCGHVNGCFDNGCAPKMALGARLRGLFATRAFNPCNDICGPCDVVACNPCEPVCGPCDVVCNPCDAACDTGCFTPRFSRPFRGFSLFGNFRINRFGCDPCGPNDCDPCGPCDVVCGPCEPVCGPCDVVCNPCDVACGTNCGPRGRLLDLPRFNLSRLFGGFRAAKCADDFGCHPCEPVCNPCDHACFR